MINPDFPLFIVSKKAYRQFAPVPDGHPYAAPSTMLIQSISSDFYWEEYHQNPGFDNNYV
jgi:hypothetical protein